MKLKNALKLGIGTTTLAASLHVSAMFLPVTDYANLANNIMQDMQAMMASMIKEEFRDAVFEMTGFGSESKVDATNNGVANAVARINQAAADLQNLAQLERSAPSRDACSATISSEAFANALCGQGSIQDEHNGLISEVSTSISEMYASISAGAGSITGLVTNAGTTSSTLTLSQKAYTQFQKRQIAEYDKYKAWSDAGKENQAKNPNLIMPMGNYNPQLSDEEIEMAKNYAFATYPPYVRTKIADPRSTNEIEEELRVKNATNFVGAVINRQIEMRLAPEPGQPSKLTTLEAQTALRFTDDGELSSDRNSWLQRITQDSSYSTHAISRDGAIMKSIKIKQMIDRYESSLLRERLLANYVLNSLNHTGNNL